MRRAYRAIKNIRRDGDFPPQWSAYFLGGFFLLWLCILSVVTLLRFTASGMPGLEIAMSQCLCLPLLLLVGGVALAGVVVAIIMVIGSLLEAWDDYQEEKGWGNDEEA